MLGKGFANRKFKWESPYLCLAVKSLITFAVQIWISAHIDLERNYLRKNDMQRRMGGMERPIIAGIVIVFLIAIAVGIIEYFVPLNARFEMNSDCRKALLLVEQQAGLTEEDKNKLREDLAEDGFKNIVITVTGGSAQGSKITLRVEADFEYPKLVDIFTRNMVLQKAIYEKTTTVRKVVN